MLKLIVGLGNPGEKHEADRHNAGFWLCDKIADHLGAQFALDAKMRGFIAHGKFKGNDVWLLKPTTFMNLSGESVGAFARFKKILPEEILVAHDELDLKPGTIRLKFSGGTGGHNGLKSISSHLSTPDYWRLRIGIGHPRDTVEKGTPHQEVASFVLKRPRKDEEELITGSIQKAIDVFDELMAEDPATAMKALHTTLKA